MSVCVCVGTYDMCVCIRWRHAAEGRRVKLTVYVTDEAEEWKEGDVFAWGDATLPWVGGWVGPRGARCR